MTKLQPFSKNKTEKVYKFPSIEQFKSTVKTLRPFCKTEDKEFIVQFDGSVKLHGTNAGVLLYPNGDIIPQGRERTLSIEKDNYGFAAYVLNTDLINFIKPKLQKILEKFNANNDFVCIGLFGEWAGTGIQKGVGIAEMKRFFAPFGICLFKEEVKEWDKTEIEYRRKWLETSTLLQFYNDELRIFPVPSIPNCTFKISIDFNDEKSIARASEILAEITNKVEQECPFAKHFDIEGIGEGVVWQNSNPLNFKDFKSFKENNFGLYELMFKVKGEKHSTSKVKKLVPIDVEKVENSEKFVEGVLTEARLNQGFEYVKTEIVNTEKDEDVSLKQTGDFIRWCVKDVIKEETDILTSSGLCLKDVQGMLSKKARSWFVNKVNNTF